jgi:uncharacterized pyridoxamine 5'-phosphate oxidase family protein
MNKSFLTVTFLTLLVSAFLVTSTLSAQDKADSPGIQKVYDFVKSCGNYYIATTDGDQPRVRPFSSLFIYEGKIYFQTGKVKAVSKQLAANPKIEIVAYNGKDKWIRIQAVAVEDDRLEAKQYALDQMPELKSMYSADDGNTQVFYLKDATASLGTLAGEEWTEKF